MVKFWFDPATAITAGFAIFNGISSIAGGQQAGNQGGAQESFFKDQADRIDYDINRTRLEEVRAREDLGIEKSRMLATGRAVAAGQGGDVDEGIISGVAGQYGDRDQRIQNDSDYRRNQLEWQRTMLKSRARYARMAGEDARTAGTLKGFGQLAAGGYSIYDSLNGGGSAAKALAANPGRGWTY